jgi:thiamine transporter
MLFLRSRSAYAFFIACEFIREYFFTGVFFMSAKTATRHDLLLRLVTSAMLIALASVLSNIKVFRLPMGGSITLLSMLPICLLSLRYGVKWGLICAFLYSVIQLAFGLADVMTWGLTPATLAGCVAFDYILPFTALGLSGVFGNTSAPRICAGITLALVLRLFCHFISGAIVFAVWVPEEWSSNYLYSIVYNGAYMGPELVITLIGAVILFKVPATRKLLIA